MLAPILRFTVFSFIWRKYKRIIIAGLIMVCSIILINYLHSDFIEYNQQLEEQHFIGVSFVVKWVMSLLILAAYILYARHMLKPVKKVDLEKPIKSKENQVNAAKSDDVFNDIRKKKTLLSKADLVIKNNHK